MEPRFVKPLRIGNYDRNLVNEPARGFCNGRPCTRNTRFVREVTTSKEHPLFHFEPNSRARARASAPNTLDALLAPTIQSCTTRTERNEPREFRCNFTYAESGRVARDPFLWNFSFVPMEKRPINFSPSKANRIESRSNPPPRSIIRIS